MVDKAVLNGEPVELQGSVEENVLTALCSDDDLARELAPLSKP